MTVGPECVCTLPGTVSPASPFLRVLRSSPKASLFCGYRPLARNSFPSHTCAPSSQVQLFPHLRTPRGVGVLVIPIFVLRGPAFPARNRDANSEQESAGPSERKPRRREQRGGLKPPLQEAGNVSRDPCPAIRCPTNRAQAPSGRLRRSRSACATRTWSLDTAGPSERKTRRREQRGGLKPPLQRGGGRKPNVRFSPATRSRVTDHGNLPSGAEAQDVRRLFGTTESRALPGHWSLGTGQLRWLNKTSAPVSRRR